MPPVDAVPLIDLQNAELEVRRLEKVLKDGPDRKAFLASELQAAEQRHHEATEAQRSLEIRHKELEIEVGSLEEQVRKYQNQQLSVKKNEEYAALEHEISDARAKIAACEDEELNILMELDERKPETEAAANEFATAQQENAEKLEDLEKALAQATTDLVGAKAERDSARSVVPIEQTRKFDRLLKARCPTPWVVHLDGDRCEGCHLKVSGEIVQGLRSSETLLACDNCGRLLVPG